MNFINICLKFLVKKLSGKLYLIIILIFIGLRLLAAKDIKRAEQSTKEHQIIYMAIKEKKIRNIKKAVKKHFDNARKYYKNLTKLNPDLIE